jgi:hypothetical protein
MLLSGFQILAKAVLLTALIITCALVHPAQISPEQFRKILVNKAGFEPADLSALDNGETVVKLLRVKDKKQVAVCGIVRLQNASEISMAAFRDSLTQKTNKSRLASGDFSTPPVIEDLESLKFGDSDIKDLKRCVVGNCNVKLPAAMIKRMQVEVDWNAADHSSQAAQLYRRILVDYASDYLKRGDRALMQYDSRKTPVRLAEDYPKLLDESLFIREVAPEFAQYLRDFPNYELSDVENSISWSKVTFGLDPVITIAHTASYSRQSNNSSLFLIANKQIYTSRYIDSSLALTMLVTIPTTNRTDSYLIFTDLSRSSVLDGAFSDVKHSLVEREATERVSDVLNRAKLRLESNIAKQVELTPTPMETGLLSRFWILGQNWAIRVFLLFMLGLILIFLYREWKLYSKREAKR